MRKKYAVVILHLLSEPVDGFYGYHAPKRNPLGGFNFLVDRIGEKSRILRWRLKKDAVNYAIGCEWPKCQFGVVKRIKGKWRITWVGRCQ